MADSPATTGDEVEITSEMIEAGVAELMAHDPRFDGERIVVEAIYVSMCRARPSANQPPA